MPPNRFTSGGETAYRVPRVNGVPFAGHFPELQQVLEMFAKVGTGGGNPGIPFSLINLLPLQASIIQFPRTIPANLLPTTEDHLSQSNFTYDGISSLGGL